MKEFIFKINPFNRLPWSPLAQTNLPEPLSRSNLQAHQNPPKTNPFRTLNGQYRGKNETAYNNGRAKKTQI